MRKQRGYAFSQADESQTRVLQAYDTTRERGRYGEMASSRPKGPFSPVSPH
jgi:phospholipid-transporting ATPase